MLDNLLLLIRNNFQFFTWLGYLCLAVLFMFCSWRLLKRQGFFWIILVLLIEAALFFTVSSVPGEPYHLAPTLMVIALVFLSFGIKSAFSYVFTLLINIFLAIGAAFLLDFIRKIMASKES